MGTEKQEEFSLQKLTAKKYAHHALIIDYRGNAWL